VENYAWLAILTLAQVIQFLITKRNKYNPHPPGEAKTCGKHGERLARLEEGIENVEKRLDRIEGKLNGMK